MSTGKPYFSCSNLEAGFVCYTADVASCCWDDRPIRIPAEQKEISALVDEYLLARKLIIQQNQGESPPRLVESVRFLSPASRAMGYFII